MSRGNIFGLAAVVGLVVCGATTPVWAVDSDGDGVDDAFDVCDNTPPDTLVDAEGRPWGDIDQDCDTDLDDFALFHQGVIGLDDFALFQQGFTGPLAPSAVVIETVTVGNSGNAGENSGESEPGGYGPDRICGAVDYVYDIGTYEVTAGQYTEFLNAVAATDTYGLWSAMMLSSDYSCKIRRTGNSGSYAYLVDVDEDDVEDADWLDRPVNFVSWGDAARFANWLHNGQPTGAQDLSTTEDGSYHLNGAMSDPELLAIVREPDATWVIPSEDEWYKAAYHHNDGVTANYWNYPMGSSAVPDNGNPGGDTGNSANFFDGDYAIGSPYYRTEGGYFGLSDSPYGTFDQGGNVWEWDEAVLYGLYRGLRGGAFIGAYNDVYLHAADRYFRLSPAYEDDHIGFRVARVP